MADNRDIQEINNGMVKISPEALAYARAAAKNQTNHQPLQLLASGFKGKGPVGDVLSNELAALRLECTRAVTGTGAVPSGKPVGEYCNAALVVSAEETAKALVAKNSSVANPTNVLSIYYAADLLDEKISPNDSEQAKKSSALARAQRIVDLAVLNEKNSPTQACSGNDKNSCAPVQVGYRTKPGEQALTTGNAMDAGFVVNTYNLFQKGENTGYTGSLTFTEDFKAAEQLCRERVPTVTTNKCMGGGVQLSAHTVPLVVKKLTAQRN